jgi:hypothetical protein
MQAECLAENRQVHAFKGLDLRGVVENNKKLRENRQAERLAKNRLVQLFSFCLTCGAL